jgi:hypothetical protein
VAINKLAVDQFGRPTLVNAVGQIDVDILVDEGPDSVNVMGDVNDTLLALAHNSVPVPPALIIETSTLPQSKKQQLLGMLNAPNPAAQASQAAQLAESQARTAKTQADAKAATATAIHKLALAQHETQKAHATQTGTAIDTMQAIAPPEAGAAQGQIGTGPMPAPAALASEANANPQSPPRGVPPQPTLPPLPGGPPQIPPGFDALPIASGQAPGGARLAPDGYHYIYAPHARGNWRKVARAL